MSSDFSVPGPEICPVFLGKPPSFKLLYVGAAAPYDPVAGSKKLTPGCLASKGATLPGTTASGMATHSSSSSCIALNAPTAPSPNAPAVNGLFLINCPA